MSSDSTKVSSHLRVHRRLWGKKQREGTVCIGKVLTVNKFEDIDVCDGLYMLGPGNGTIRTYCLVGVGVSLWAWA